MLFYAFRDALCKLPRLQLWLSEFIQTGENRSSPSLVEVMHC